MDICTGGLKVKHGHMHRGFKGQAWDMHRRSKNGPTWGAQDKDPAVRICSTPSSQGNQGSCKDVCLHTVHNKHTYQHLNILQHCVLW